MSFLLKYSIQLGPWTQKYLFLLNINVDYNDKQMQIFVNFKFRGAFCRLLFFLASEERVSKQLKQVSIV